MLKLPTYEDVIAASARLKGVAHRTPVLTSRTINDETGAELDFLRSDVASVRLSVIF